ncbi:MAG TPA: CRTAC1 family protein, partial [Candidatus Polarisedimenticolaceae bacterium]|nr:CRTAC1 family protein [Candidatus Polarisedimenticolaceae bacterium]
RYVDVAKQAHLDVIQVGGGASVDYIIDSLGAGAAWLDYDGDGDPDLYLAEGATPEHPRSGPPDRLLRNDGDTDHDGVPDFSDVTARAGLGDTLWSFGVAAADYDNDGDTDLFVTNWGPDRLYRNNGNGTFTEIGAAAGLADTGWGASAVWADVDRDGDLDLYVTRYIDFDFARAPRRGQRRSGGKPPCIWKGIEVFCGPRGLPAAYDSFYRNEGDPDGDGVPRFREVAAAVGLRAEEPFYGLAAHFFDADDDGDDDLYVGNDSIRNSFFVNRGDGTFEEQAIPSGLAYNEEGNEQASMGIAGADYDGDGRFDLAVTNFSHDYDTLYRNTGANLFIDASFVAGIGSPSYFDLAWGISFADLDRDGWEDLVVANGHVYPQVDGRDLGTTFRQRNRVFRNRGDGKFEDWTARLGPGLEGVRGHRALLPVDLDVDGDVDLLFTTFNGPPVLLRASGVTGHWLEVALTGAKSNRDGIGARVTLQAGGRRQLREIRRNAGYAGSILPIAQFGLAGATVVDRLEVRWPSGRSSVRENVKADQRLTIRE